MNKFPSLVATAAAALMSSAAMAQGYVAVDGGRGHLDGVCAQAGTCASSAAAYRVTAGFKLGDGWAFEAAFQSQGKVTSASLDVVQTVQLRSLEVGGLYEWDLNSLLGLTARAGAVYQHATSDSTVLPTVEISTKSNGAAPYAGVGGIVTVSRQIRLQAGIEWSRADFAGTTNNVRTATAGVRYEF